MSCDHIALTVKAHVDEDEWNASTSGMLRNTTKDESLPAKTTPANADSVDDTVRTTPPIDASLCKA